MEHLCTYTMSLTTYVFVRSFRIRSSQYHTLNIYTDECIYLAVAEFCGTQPGWEGDPTVEETELKKTSNPVLISSKRVNKINIKIREDKKSWCEYADTITWVDDVNVVLYRNHQDF